MTLITALNDTNLMQAHIRQAEKQCRAHDTQLTVKRKLVFTTLLQAGKAVSAYELIELCERNSKKSLPPMSVYRILDFLESIQLVHRLNIANKYVACAHIGTDHTHTLSQFLLCNQCQCVDEIQLNTAKLIELDSEVKQTGYQLLSSQIELNCICNACFDEQDNATNNVKKTTQRI